MRFYTQQHQFYCGIDLHARPMYLCLFNRDGEILVHRHMPAGPEPFLKTIAPYRADLVVCVECIFTCYWLADLCAREGIPCVLGHALSMQAIHGGKATHDKSAAQTIAVLWRGGMLPQASGSPAERRATRDRRRRRLPLARTRGARLAHLHKTNRQDTLPAMSQKIVDKTNRDGGAKRCAAPAVPKSIAVDLARITYDDALRRAVARTFVTTAQHHDAQTLSLRHTVPGMGQILSLVLLYDIQHIDRFPRGQACASSCRLVTCAKASAGKRSGTSGTTIGHAPLTWAFSAAAVFVLREHPAGQTCLTRLEQKQRQGKAVTIFAPTWARAV